MIANLEILFQDFGNFPSHVEFSWAFLFQNVLGKILLFLKSILKILVKSWNLVVENFGETI